MSCRILRSLLRLCLAPLALNACDSDSGPVGPIWSGPTLSATFTPGGPDWISCTDNIQIEPHFTDYPPPLTLYDPIDSLTDRCGDLVFNDRERSFTVIYATYMTGEYPWKYWWRWSRSATSGITRDTAQVRKVSTGANVPDTATIPMPLDGRDDGVAAVLLTSDIGTYPLTDSVFLDPQWYATDKANLIVQHWRRIGAPRFDSVRRTAPLKATLWWQNQHGGRSIDSTIVFRDDSAVARVGHTATSYTDSVPATDTYEYALKHFTDQLLKLNPAPGSIPNSDSSVRRQVVVNYEPHASFTVTCQQLPCSFTDASTDADGSIVSRLWTFGDGDSATTQHPTHVYATGGWYQVRLVVTDDFGATDDTTIVAAPLQLGMLGPTTVKPKVTCEWYADPQGGNGGMTYSWQIGGQEVGSDEYLHWYTGTSGFQITLIGAAGDGQVDTAAVSVTISQQAPNCVLK